MRLELAAFTERPMLDLMRLVGLARLLLIAVAQLAWAIVVHALALLSFLPLVDWRDEPETFARQEC